jgi:peptidoglycan/LPS O-acetylase OafA/YrhL
MEEQKQPPLEMEPRWPVAVALLTVSGLYAALPAPLAVIPHWYLLIIVLALLVPTRLAHYRGHHDLNQRLGYVVNGVVTAAMVGSLALLIRALPTRDETPVRLLCSAASLWVTNILVFALWYWRLDAGGPNRRDQRVGHPTGAFWFPQMVGQDPQAPTESQTWSPNFVDYLFLAFNASTA